MVTATLRNRGGSVVLAVPKEILGLVDLRAGSEIRISVNHRRLIVGPKTKPHYTLGGLLAKTRRSDVAPKLKDRLWLTSGPLGKEAL